MNKLNYITTNSGLKYIDHIIGNGEPPEVGSKIVVHYIGKLENGTKFDSSYNRNQPFTFTIGIGQVIKGWDEGLLTMQVGGKRTLIIPSDLGYGFRGAGDVIPPNATLIFEVELIEIIQEIQDNDFDPTGKEIAHQSGLKYINHIIGEGLIANNGNLISVHYTGLLENGHKFDSSHDRGRPFTFTLGKKEVIKGWDEGISGMKIGGKRTLKIPSELAYGKRGLGNIIPPNANLVFKVELIDISQ